MGSERVKIEKQVKDCNNSWCDNYVGCRGHTLIYRYNSVVEIYSVELDGHNIISAGDVLIQAIADIINEGMEATYIVL